MKMTFAVAKPFNKNCSNKSLFIILLCLPSVWFLFQFSIWRHALKTFHLHRSYKVKHGRFLVDTIACRIPDMDPFDDSIKKYIYQEKPIICNATHPLPLIESDSTSLYINQEAISYYKKNYTSGLRCCYQPFFRVEDTEDYFIDSEAVDLLYRFHEEKYCFTSNIYVKEEFVRVVCYLDSIEIYKDYHAFVPFKKDVEDRVKLTRTKDAVSVLIIGVDAISRLNLYRQMPETVSFIKENMNVMELLGYNRVDYSTFQNLIPMLSGLTVEQLSKVCWQSLNMTFDDCPFVWKNYSSEYITMFTEDSSELGMFNLDKYGFKKQPTDYYTRIFDYVCRNEIGHEVRVWPRLCMGVRLSLEVLLNYVEKFAITMLDRLSFGFVWSTSLSHDILNLSKYGDKYYVKLFTKLLNAGVFNKTVLIFMSDHGIRNGEIVTTYQGYLEDRLPFLFIAYPDWFKNKYVTAIGNLRKNTRRLTTTFDLYETLIDLSNLDTLNRISIRRRARKLYLDKKVPRGISLFLPIFKERTCEKAGIELHWCTCHQSVMVSVNNINVKQTVNFVMTQLNKLLIPYPMCSRLKLGKIMNARIATLNNTDKASIQYYTLTMQTVPGNALFEATVMYNSHFYTFDLAGGISRINLYGNQSYCVKHFQIKLYCYCLVQSHIHTNSTGKI